MSQLVSFTATPFDRVRPGRHGIIPTDRQCRTWWNDYAMLEHIKRHSELVADVATELARQAADKGLGDILGLGKKSFIQSVRAAGLLHDLGKSYSIAHGGNHSQLGGTWTMELTKNPALAQGVIHHVHWPGELDPNTYFLPLAVIYSDKRVMHDTLVTIEERFDDLRVRYGHSERSRELIASSYRQGKELEHILSTFLGENLHEYFIDRRWLVS